MTSDEDIITDRFQTPKCRGRAQVGQNAYERQELVEGLEATVATRSQNGSSTTQAKWRNKGSPAYPARDHHT